ncbi:MAG: hypothetical protein R2725_03240 [Solirubrobacterales bacterium]
MRTSHLQRLLGGAVAALAALALAAPLAQGATPAEGYEDFAGCPSPSENPEVAICMHSLIKGGNFKMGSKDVPLDKPMTLTGGLNAELGGFAANSEGGLSEVKQLVPGGLIGITGLEWLVNFLTLGQLKLYAVTELVGEPEIGEGLTLPIRVHLINSALGGGCYVGSVSNPIVLNLSEAVEPEFSIDEELGIVKFLNGTYVDNTFSAPGANGCTLYLLGFVPISINGLVNSTAGLPAGSGSNETEQDIDIEIAPSELVYP